ncbi:MAG TPA: hypothetical protein VFQ45_15455 [Longimicrobium sp.]|nr:hypothetical protein [Longimicrobium sp.]
MISRILACLLLSLAAAACDGATEPEGIEGLYEVATVNGDDPPEYINWNGSQEGGTQLTGALLRIIPPDSIALALVTRTVEDGDAGPKQTEVFRGTYQVEAGHITTSMLRSDTDRPLGFAAGAVLDGRIDLTVNMLAPAYTGYFSYPVSMSFRR